MKNFLYLFLIIMVIGCSGFKPKPTNEIDFNIVENEYVNIIVNRNFDFLRKEERQAEEYCGDGGIVNCGNGSRKLIINGVGPFIHINKLTYFYINDGFPDNLDENRVKSLEIEFLSVNYDSTFKSISRCKGIKSLEAGKLNFSGQNLNYAIEASLDDDAFCHLVNHMAIRIGADHDSLLIIRYSEDVSKDYFKHDWGDISNLSEQQTALLVEFKNNCQKVLDFVWKSSQRTNT